MTITFLIFSLKAYAGLFDSISDEEIEEAVDIINSELDEKNNQIFNDEKLKTPGNEWHQKWGNKISNVFTSDEEMNKKLNEVDYGGYNHLSVDCVDCGGDNRYDSSDIKKIEKTNSDVSRVFLEMNKGKKEEKKSIWDNMVDTAVKEYLIEPGLDEKGWDIDNVMDKLVKNVSPPESVNEAVRGGVVDGVMGELDDFKMAEEKKRKEEEERRKLEDEKKKIRESVSETVKIVEKINKKKYGDLDLPKVPSEYSDYGLNRFFENEKNYKNIPLIADVYYENVLRVNGQKYTSHKDVDIQYQKSLDKLISKLPEGSFEKILELIGERARKEAEEEYRRNSGNLFSPIYFTPSSNSNYTMPKWNPQPIREKPKPGINIRIPYLDRNR